MVTCCFSQCCFSGSQKGPVTTTAEFVSYLAPFPKNAKVSKVSKKERKEQGKEKEEKKRWKEKQTVDRIKEEGKKGMKAKGNKGRKNEGKNVFKMMGFVNGKDDIPYIKWRKGRQNADHHGRVLPLSLVRSHYPGSLFKKNKLRTRSLIYPNLTKKSPGRSTPSVIIMSRRNINS